MSNPSMPQPIWMARSGIRRVGWLFFLPLLLCPAGRSTRAAEIKSIPVGVVPFAMCGLDVNADRRVDLVVGGVDQDAICAVDVSGKVLWRQPTEGMPLAVRSGDVDGDGQEEIVAIIGTSASKIVVLRRNGEPVREIQPEAVVYLLRLADIDGDGHRDIITAGFLGKILVYDGRGKKLLGPTVTTKSFMREMAGLGAGDVDGDGRCDIAFHSSLQLPGLIDSDGEPLRRWMLPSLQGGLADCADIDQDGKVELLFACLSQVRAERQSSRLWSADVGQRPAELATSSDGKQKHPWEYGGTRSLVAGDMTADRGLEIASFASDGKFDLLSSTGERLVHTKTRYPLLNISAADVDADGFDEVLLARLHYQNVYVLDMQNGREPADQAVQKAFAIDRVTDEIDKLLTRIDAMPPRRARARSNKEKLHVLWGMEATTAPGLMAGTIRVIDQKMRELRCDNVEYAFMFTLKEKGVAKYKRDGICAVGPLAASGEKLLDQCREWERMGVRFYPVVSHMGVPTVMPETARKIMEVAPTACQGYLTWETLVNYPSEVWYDFLYRMDDLAQICLKRGKRILFAEESPFWTALVSDPKARAILLKPEYRHVLVPVLKTLRPQGDETDVAAYVGSLRAGEIEAWGITSEEDFWPFELGHYRGCPDDIVMRQDVMAVALGASFILVESGHLYFEPMDSQGNYNPLLPTAARVSREARREHLAVELFRKGILSPVPADDLLSISPVGFALAKSPRVDRFPMMWEAHGLRMYDGLGLLNSDLTRPIMNTGPYSMARNFYNAKKLMNGIFPAMPWGIVPIYGPQAASGTAHGKVLIATDGERVTWQGKDRSAEQAMPDLVRAIRSAANELPFQTEDDVFLSACRSGPDGYQVILMDTEMFAPTDIQTTIRTTLPKVTCRDELTGQSLEVRDHQVAVTVPGGGFRILRFDVAK